MTIWSTGTVAGNHRAVLRDGRLVAVAESVEEAAYLVRLANAKFELEPFIIETPQGPHQAWVDKDNQDHWRPVEWFMTPGNGWRMLYVQSL